MAPPESPRTERKRNSRASSSTRDGHSIPRVLPPFITTSHSRGGLPNADDTGRVEITSHNHGFAVDPGADARSRPAGVDLERGAVTFTHWNLNDDTLEGLRCNDLAAFSVQYHPEASPGPHDAAYLFDEFRSLMEHGKA